METRTIAGEAEIKRMLTSDFDNGFSHLVRTYQPDIYRGARRLTHRTHDAQDVAQDTFVRAYAALLRFDQERIEALSVRPWLWTIALNLCRNRASRSKPESQLLDHDRAESTDDGVFDDIEWNRRFATLNSHQRNAVVMRHVLDMPIAEIASATGRPEGTIKADVSRGLERLRMTMHAEALNAER
jgi:RNA polymerase sigma-70 factor (ECF subfamily)